MSLRRARPALLAAAVVAAAALVAVSAGAPAAGAPVRTEPTFEAKKRCKIVIRKVRGKRKRVRVCRVVRPPRPTTPPPPAAPPPPPATGGLKVTAIIPVLGRPNIGSLAVGAGAVWVRMAPDALHRIDAATNRLTATVTVDRGSVGWVEIGEGAVWVSNYDADTVSRVDPATNAVVATIAVGDAPTGIATTPGAVWVANHHGNSVSRIDPSTNAVVATIPVASSAPEVGPQSLAASGGAVWVVGADTAAGPQLKRIDPASNAVTVVRQLGGGCAELVPGPTLWLWTDGCEAGSIAEVDLSSGATVGTVAVGAPGEAALGLGALWIANLTAEVVRVDPSARTVTGRLRVGQLAGVEPPLAVGQGAAWTAGVGVVVRVEG